MASIASFGDVANDQSAQFCSLDATACLKRPPGSVISYKRTFLELTASENSLSPRAWSDPGSATGAEYSEYYYGLEQMYAGHLQEQLEEQWEGKSKGTRSTRSPCSTLESSRASTFEDLSSLLSRNQRPMSVSPSHLVPTSGPQKDSSIRASRYTDKQSGMYSSSSSVTTDSKQAENAVLIIKNTFFDVSASEHELSPRAASDPGSTSGTEYSEEPCGPEKLRIGHLQEQWAKSSDDSSALRDQDLASAFGVGKSTSSPVESIGACLVSKPKRISDFKVKQTFGSALSAIEEIPEQVEAVLQSNAAILTTQLQDEVQQVRSMIGDARSLNEKKDKDKAVQNIQALPHMVSNAFEESVVLTKRTVQQSVDGVIQELAATTDNEEIVGQIRLIPAAVKEIVGKAISEATQNFKVQAQQQIEDAIQRLPEACKVDLPCQREVKAQMISIVPDVFPVTLGKVERAAENAIEHAVAALQAERNGAGFMVDNNIDIANQAVADALLRGKVCDGKANPPAGELHPLNPGSWGHPELCPRPCLFFAAGQCSNGNSCSFCHLPHPNRSAHLDKRQRDIVKSMDVAELQSVLRPIMIQKLRGCHLQQNIRRLVDEVLGEEDRNEHAAPDTNSSSREHQALRKLRVSLQQMSLRSLFGLLHRSTISGNHPLRNRLNAIISELRIADP